MAKSSTSQTWQFRDSCRVSSALSSFSEYWNFKHQNKISASTQLIIWYVGFTHAQCKLLPGVQAFPILPSNASYVRPFFPIRLCEFVCRSMQIKFWAPHISFRSLYILGPILRFFSIPSVPPSSNLTRKSNRQKGEIEEGKDEWHLFFISILDGKRKMLSFQEIAFYFEGTREHEVVRQFLKLILTCNVAHGIIMT